MDIINEVIIMSGKKDGREYSEEVREFARELLEKGDTYKVVKSELYKAHKVKPSDAWIREVKKEIEDSKESEGVSSTSSSERPTLDAILKGHLKKPKVERISQNFDLSHGRPQDLIQIMEIENVKNNVIKSVIYGMWGQDVMERLFGKATNAPDVVAPKKSTIDAEFDNIMHKDLQITKTKLLKKQLQQISSDETKSSDGLSQISQLMMLDKMTKEERKDSTGEIMGIVSAMKGLRDDTSQQILLSTIEAMREDSRMDREGRMQEKQQQFQRDSQLRDELDRERIDAVSREMQHLQEERQRSVSTAEDFGQRLMFWKDVIHKFNPEPKGVDVSERIEMKKIDLQDKALDTAVKVMDSRLMGMEKRFDKAVDVWLSMMERQQASQLQQIGGGRPHPRSPVRPPPRSTEEREQAYAQLDDEVLKVEKLKKIRKQLGTHGLKP